MAFDFYCTYCGKKLTNDQVLFDLAPIVSTNQTQFKLFSFKVLLKDLVSLFEKGCASSDNYMLCSLTFEELMFIAADEHNLNDPKVSQLSMKNVEEYRESGQKKVVQKKKSGLFDDDEDDPQPQKEVAYSMPEAVQAVLYSSKKIQAGELDEGPLQSDFDAFHAAFSTEGRLVFELRLEDETDSHGEKIITGYSVRTQKTRFSNASRFCPHCKKSIFEHAGTAHHQSIVLVGYRTAGKTSTILALASFIQNGLINYGYIWEKSDNLSSFVKTVELLSPSEDLMKDIGNYNSHVAPKPTQAEHGMTDINCATFRVCDLKENKHIITLTDVPGELFKLDGSIIEDKFYNEFQVALSCDAYIAFFDTTAGQTSMAEATNVCKWTDKMQHLRMRNMDADSYVPVMLVFTKCADLESSPPTESLTVQNQSVHLSLDPVANTYMFYAEKYAIEKSGNPMYEHICKQRVEVGELRTAYSAIMRCSPYGYPAPTDDHLDKVDATKRPIHVDWLMKWILSVTGSIAPNATYLGFGNPDQNPSSDDYQLTRQQKRRQNPIDGEKEALLRAYLFDNPGRFDRKCLESFDNKGAAKFNQFNMRIHPDTNDNVK